jgi:DNA-binding NtrC family response regulator
MKILVVDDEMLIRWFFERSLLKLGHSVTSAKHVSEAKELLNETQFDVVMADIRMPGENGLVLVRELLDRHYEPHQIIVCSAYINADVHEQLTDMGVDILRKPFNLKEFQHSFRNRRQDTCKEVA